MTNSAFDIIEEEGSFQQLSEYVEKHFGGISADNLAKFDQMDFEHREQLLNEAGTNDRRAVAEDDARNQAVLDEVRAAEEAVADALEPTYWEAGVVHEDGTVEILNLYKDANDAVNEVATAVGEQAITDHGVIGGINKGEAVDIESDSETFFIRPLNGGVSQSQGYKP